MKKKYDEEKLMYATFKNKRNIRIEVDGLSEVEIKMIQDVLYAMTNRVSTLYSGFLKFEKWVDEK